MDHIENCFLSRNKIIEEKLDLCIHNIETRLDKLFSSSANFHDVAEQKVVEPWRTLGPRTPNLVSNFSFSHFKAPYIRDFRNFSGPSNDDVRQIRGLTGTENIDLLIKNKSWSKESKQQLKDAVLDHYSQIHLVGLIKQKNILIKQLHSSASKEKYEVKNDFQQKISLVEEQAEQVRARKEQRIFVPEDRLDSSIDWCAISAKLTSTHHDAQDCRLMWSNQLHWSVNNGTWTNEEDTCLMDAIEKYGRNDWDAVARELNCNRLPWQCCSRYQEAYASSDSGSNHINEDDSDKIIEVINLCRIGNFVPWNQVMYFIQYHSLLQVKYQWQKFLSERKFNQPWSHAEDVLLLKTIERFGDKEWNRIASYVPGRSNKSCRERYIMRLKYEKRTVGNWRRKEDEALVNYVGKFGTNWALISSHFPERNDHQLRNRYELLSKDPSRVGPIKRKKLYRNSEGFLVSIYGRRQKTPNDLEVDERLRDIFSTYQQVKSSTKSLVCRGAQDELIYQTLIQVICKYIGSGMPEPTLLSSILEKVVVERNGARFGLFAPCASTLRGFKAWRVQQDYLTQFLNKPVDIESITSTREYEQLLKVTISLFLWPAILSRISKPDVDPTKCPSDTIIKGDAKNLYKIRDIQQRLISNSM